MYCENQVFCIQDELQFRRKEEDVCFSGDVDNSAFVAEFQNEEGLNKEMGAPIPLVSFIIPVYNTPSDLLERGIRSCSCQGFPVEIIAVDDGSEYATALALDDIAVRYKEVRAFHKSNHGVSSARNYGLTKVRGDFVAFLDADDVYEASFVSEALDILKRTNADVVFGDYIYVSHFGESHSVMGPFSNVHECVFEGAHLEDLKCAPFYCGSLEQFGLPRLYLTSACSALYRTRCATSARFDEAITISEDRLYVLDVIDNANKAVLTDRVWYQYIQYEKSASSQLRINAIEDLGQTVSAYRRRLNGASPKLMHALYHGMFEAFVQVLFMTVWHDDFSDVMGMSRSQYIKQAIDDPVFDGVFDKVQRTSSTSLAMSFRYPVILRLAKHGQVELLVAFLLATKIPSELKRTLYRLSSAIRS